MWDEKEISQLLEEYNGKKPWHKRASIWVAAAIVPTALMVNIVAPTVKTFAAERVYAQTVAEQELVTDFTALSKHVQPSSDVNAIIYFNLPETWQINAVTINQETYELHSGHDAYLVKLTAPEELGHWEVALEQVTVYDGALYHEVMIGKEIVIDVETHVPHFEEVHPEKPKVQEDGQGAQEVQHDTYQVGEKAKTDMKFKTSEGDKIKQLEKYVLGDDKNLFKKIVKFKEKPEFLSEHGEVVGVVFQNTLYPATIQADGQLQIYGLDAATALVDLQYIVYEDGSIVPAPSFSF
ncbi:MAG: hypothetical protein ACRCWD_02915 [Culicoidibacterales bacterium]